MDNQDNALLNQEDIGISLELSNITSGGAASTMAMLVDGSIELSPPEIDVYPDIASFVSKANPGNAILTTVNYTKGLSGSLAYILALPAAKAIGNALMGDSPDAANDTLPEPHLNAVGEVISQMMGASVSGMSQFLSYPMSLSAHQIGTFSPEKLMEWMPQTGQDGLVVLRYKILGSNIVPEADLFQVMTVTDHREQINTFRTMALGEGAAPAGDAGEKSFEMAGVGSSQPTRSGVNMEEMELNPVAAGFGGGSFESSMDSDAGPVTVRPVEFPSFDSHVSPQGVMNKNLELVMDVCLNLTVELGRSELPIKEVLELSRGSVIELNRVAGEPVDLYANGKLIAKGEVVVIEDNFGLRITSIVSPADRLRGL